MTEQGEAEFRHLELQVLRDLVRDAPPGAVVATGGGLVETPEARALLPQLGRVVWLRADPRACVARLGAERAARPLLDAGTDWLGRFARREPLYRELAQGIVDTHPQGVEQSLAQLEALFAPRSPEV
jgi:shikimate kinase